MSTEYDPIPTEIREAWERFRAVVEDHGLSLGAPLLHSAYPLEQGDDRVMEGGRVARYWPVCGPGPTVLSIVGPPTPNKRSA
jgi:hypothetical protein